MGNLNVCFDERGGEHGLGEDRANGNVAMAAGNGYSRCLLQARLSPLYSEALASFATILSRIDNQYLCYVLD